MNRHFLNLIKALCLGLPIYYIAAYLLSLVINTGDILGMINGIVLTCTIIFCTLYIVDVIREEK